VLPAISEPEDDLETSGMVVALYEGEWFPAKICENQKNVAKGYQKLSYMAIKGLNSFSWPAKEDIVETLRADIILRDIEVVPVNNRHLGLSVADLKKVRSILVWSTVFFCCFFNWPGNGSGGPPLRIFFYLF